MQFPEEWLRSMVDPALSTDELVHLLTMAGLEVEECRPVAPAFEGVVVGQIVAIAPHPNADRLKVCTVSAGEAGMRSVVCGAPNAEIGMRAPLALVGARLPSADGLVEIRRTTMRGVESEGMLCSARELGLSDDHSGLLRLEDDAPVGRNVRDVLTLDDQLLTIKLTPNRADCLSVLGLAREVAALTGAALDVPAVPAVPPVGDGTFPVRISAPDGCGRFTGRVIMDVDASAPTPAWMRRRLERAGQRSISALVDVTNYVMLELGRPLHVYDLDKLRGGIDVRFGRSGERLKLLNEQVVEVDDSVLVIADDSGPIGLAGIMGGDSTKADLATRHVLLEAAFFYPEAIAGRARRFNFSSDASHRFERGVDFDNNLQGIERATQLILDICGGRPGPASDHVALLPVRRPVRMRVRRAQRVIGVPVPGTDMAGIFRRLGFDVEEESGGDDVAFMVTPPSYRFDIQIEEDLIEEVARVHGFDRIPTRPPVAPAQMLAQPEAVRSLHDVRDILVSLDYHEVINFSFVDACWEKQLAGRDDPIRVLNPIAEQYSVMRSTLLGGLLAGIRHNVNRKIGRVRLFEVGRVFLRDPRVQEGPMAVHGVAQPMRVAAAAFGPALDEQWGVATRPVDFFDVKADVEALFAPAALRFEARTHPALHPGRSAEVLLDGVPVGWLGEIHPRWQQEFELPGVVIVFELDARALCRCRIPSFAEVSRFPPVRRDMAVLLDERVPAGDVVEALQAALPAVVEAVELFDVYRGQGIPAGKKSLAFRVLFQDTEKTLTDAEVDEVMSGALSIVREHFGGELRQ
jgi:phenylalanyl-tRNA synthetase beta chain